MYIAVPTPKATTPAAISASCQIGLVGLGQVREGDVDRPADEHGVEDRPDPWTHPQRDPQDEQGDTRR